MVSWSFYPSSPSDLYPPLGAIRDPTEVYCLLLGLVLTLLSQLGYANYAKRLTVISDTCHKGAGRGWTWTVPRQVIKEKVGARGHLAFGGLRVRQQHWGSNL